MSSQEPNSRFSIPESHPALAGHFPGNPVVPGVVIMEHVMQLFSLQYPQYSVTSIKNSKFIKPIIPALEVDVDFTVKNGIASFICCAINDETVLVKGELCLHDASR